MNTFPYLWQYYFGLFPCKIVVGEVLMITFDPFWKTLKNKQISQYDLVTDFHMSRGMLDNLKHNRSITLNTLNQLCNTFDCDIHDIICYKKD